MIAKRESFEKHIKNECEGFIRGSKHRETDESTRPQAECFYCFLVFGTPDETRSTSFWDDFSNDTIKKICSDTLFCNCPPSEIKTHKIFIRVFIGYQAVHACDPNMPHLLAVALMNNWWVWESFVGNFRRWPKADTSSAIGRSHDRRKVSGTQGPLNQIAREMYWDQSEELYVNIGAY